MVAAACARAVLPASQNIGHQRHHPSNDSERADRKLDAGLEHCAFRGRGAGNRVVAVSEEEFLMRFPALVLLAISTAFGEPRIDNVLVKMVPPAATSLVGAHMDQIRNTEFYRKLLERQ